jgi:hypothetical protein
MQHLPATSGISGMGIDILELPGSEKAVQKPLIYAAGNGKIISCKQTSSEGNLRGN